MRDFRLLRIRPPQGLSGIVLYGIVGTIWTLQALAQSQSPIPSAASRKTSSVTTPTDHKPKPATPSEKPVDLVFKGPNRYVSRTGVLKGQLFVYKEEDATITGDNGTYNTKTKILDADGHLIFDDTTHHATADQAHVDDDAQIADFQGNIVLVLKPQQSATADATKEGKNDNSDSLKRHGVTVTCDKLQDQYAEDKKIVKMYGHLIFKQSYTEADGEPVERILTAEHAEYDGKAEIMVLFPPVSGHDNKGGKYDNDAPVKIGTREGEETIETVGGHYVFFPDHKPVKSGQPSSGVGQGGAESSGQKDAKTSSKPDASAGGKPASGDGGKSSTSGNANPPPANSTGGG